MILELSSLSFKYGGNSVISDLHLDLRKGELLGIIGPNGAGKTTLFSLIAGNVRPSAGSIRFAGKDLAGMRPWHRSRAGIGRTYQIPRPFRNMTVYENLLVGALHGAGLSDRAAGERAEMTLEMTGLQRHLMKPAGSLSLLDLKRLELAKAMAQNPQLLLLDEIAGGLTEAECHSLLEIITRLHAEGRTIIWIEHVLHALRSVASRIAVLHGGRFAVDGLPEEVLSSETVRQIYTNA
jgi:branched-chain amino acid transport system ATP-binding protein